MIAISSHKPHSSSAAYAHNQAVASRSWVDKFKDVYYFGSYEKEICHPKTIFARLEGSHPKIKTMVEMASMLDSDYVALINADIVLTEPFLEVTKKILDMALPAATSYRYEFMPDDPGWMENALRHKEDRGMDIFIAAPPIWRQMAREMPEDLFFGHQTWDSWVCGWMCFHLGYGFRHFTDYRCVFHPKHGGRETPLSSQIKSDSPYFTRAKRPSPL